MGWSSPRLEWATGERARLVSTRAIRNWLIEERGRIENFSNHSFLAKHSVSNSFSQNRLPGETKKETHKKFITLVTGAGGFIGSAVVAEFRRQAYRKIRAVDIKPLDEWYQVFDDVEN